MTGFKDVLKDTRLAHGAYVAATDEYGTIYCYMQDITKGEVCGKYYFISHNSLLKNQ